MKKETMINRIIDNSKKLNRKSDSFHKKNYLVYNYEIEKIGAKKSNEYKHPIDAVSAIKSHKSITYKGKNGNTKMRTSKSIYNNLSYEDLRTIYNEQNKLLKNADLQNVTSYNRLVKANIHTTLLSFDANTRKEIKQFCKKNGITVDEFVKKFWQLRNRNMDLSSEQVLLLTMEEIKPSSVLEKTLVEIQKTKDIKKSIEKYKLH